MKNFIEVSLLIFGISMLIFAVRGYRRFFNYKKEESLFYKQNIEVWTELYLKVWREDIKIGELKLWKVEIPRAEFFCKECTGGDLEEYFRTVCDELTTEEQKDFIIYKFK